MSTPVIFMCLSLYFQAGWGAEAPQGAPIPAVHASGRGGVWGPPGGDSDHAEIGSSLQQQQALLPHLCRGLP